MEAIQKKKKKFVCKFCHKRYPCGKSLGGHIRTHMNNGNSAEAEGEGEGEAKLFNGRNPKKESGLEASGQSGYGLRENPKRTKRFVDSSSRSSLQQEMICCKECGKGFQSLKALCGHMACHSEKDKVKTSFEDCIEEYDTIGSSSVSGIEQEQEEVAICLMMLSMDSSHKKGLLNSFADSSDNNSVVLEAKSSSIDMRITVNSGVNFVEEMKKARDGELKSAEIDLSDNSDSGYFRNGPKKIESDASVDGFEDHAQVDQASRKFDSRKRAKNDSSSPEIFSSRAEKRSKFECLTCNKVFHSHRSLWGHTASHSRINFCCESTNESRENSIETDSSPLPMPNSNGKTPIEQNLCGNVEKISELKKNEGHVCPFCFRVFKSGQALGGHKRSHFVGGTEDRRPVIIIKQQDSDEMPGVNVIDLNLPAPIDEEAIENSGFLQW